MSTVRPDERASTQPPPDFMMSGSKSEVTAHSDYNIYAQQLALLGYGLPLWQPAPLNDYKRVKVADVGYIRTGQFYRMFNASLPGDHQTQTWGVPRHFQQLQLDHPISQPKQPRPPGALHSRHMRAKGVDFELGADPAWVNNGATVHFESSSDQGAILITRDHTYREDALQLGFLETYIAKNFESWLDFANTKLGRGIKLDDLILVTGYDLTSQFAMAAFAEGSRNLALRFKAAYPSVARASIGTWGEWQTTTSVYQNFGPHVPGVSSMAITVGIDDLPTGCDQCVFLRGFRIRKRAGLFPKVIKASAGPHDLPPGNRNDEKDIHFQPKDQAEDAETMFERDEISISPVADTEPFVDPLEPYFRYIFENSDAQLALVHDNDLSALLEIDLDQDVDRLLKDVLPEIKTIDQQVRRLQIPSNVFQQYSWMMAPPLYEPPYDPQSHGLASPPLSMPLDYAGSEGDPRHSYLLHRGSGNLSAAPRGRTLARSQSSRSSHMKRRSSTQGSSRSSRSSIVQERERSSDAVHSVENLSRSDTLGSSRSSMSSIHDGRDRKRFSGTGHGRPNSVSSLSTSDDHVPGGRHNVLSESTQKRREATRKQRIEAEQRRRDELRDGFKRLKQVLPAVKYKTSKVILLNRAMNHINKLEQSVATLRVRSAAVAAGEFSNTSDRDRSLLLPSEARSDPDNVAMSPSHPSISNAEMPILDEVPDNYLGNARSLSGPVIDVQHPSLEDVDTSVPDGPFHIHGPKTLSDTKNMTRRERMEHEQQRRDELRDGYNRLQSILPMSNLKSSKVSLLERAANYVVNLQECITSLQTRNDELSAIFNKEVGQKR